MHILGDDKRQQTIGGAKVLCEGEIPVSYHLNPFLLKREELFFFQIFLFSYIIFITYFFSTPHKIQKGVWTVVCLGHF